MDQAKLEKYANWLVQNKDKKGTPEFETVANAYKQGRSMAAASTETQAPSGPSDASTALSDPEWAKKGRILFKENNRQDFKGSDAEAAQYLNDYLYDFNYRLVGAGTDGTRGTLDTAAQISGYSDEGKKAFVDAQTQFENMNTTLGGVGQAAKRVFTDPTTYVGLGSFGVGTAAGQGAKYAAKEGVKELAKVGAKRVAARGAVTGAVEGATYGAVSDLGQQQAMVNAGGQDAIDFSQTAKTAGLSAVAGGGLGAGVGAIAGGIAGRNPSVQAARQLVDDPQRALRGAEITQRVADLQQSSSRLDPETVLGAKEVNANAGVLTDELKANLKATGVEPTQLAKYNKVLDKALGMNEADINALRGTPEGNAVADHIVMLQQTRAMTRQVPNEGLVPRFGRMVMDKYIPGIGALTDPIKQALFPARKTAEERIAKLAKPRNIKIAQEISRLGGQSDAAISRQQLSEMVDIARVAKEKAKAAVEAKNALLKETSLKLEREAILKNEVPSGGKFAYAHMKTGLKPQQVLDGMDQLVAQGLVPPEVLKMFDEDPKKLYQDNVFNKILDRLNTMAESGVLQRDEKWSPNTGDQVMQQGIDAIRYQAGVDQIKSLQDAAIAAPKDLRSQKIVVDAVQAMMAAGANQKARMAVFETALSRTKTPEERKAVASALEPLKEYFKSKYRGNRRAD